MKLKKTTLASSVTLALLVSSLSPLYPTGANAAEPPLTAIEACGKPDKPLYSQDLPAPAPFARDAEGNEISIRKLRNQIAWINFNDPSAMSGPELTNAIGQSNIAGKIIPLGAVYEKELAPGYILRGEVVALDPLTADTRNWSQSGDGTSETARGKRGPANIFATPQSQTYSHLRRAGITTCDEYTALGAQFDGGNVGFTMRFTATINGVPTAPTIVVADSEEAGSEEAEIFKTNGTPWKLLAEVGENRNSPSTFRNTPIDLNQCGLYGFHTSRRSTCPAATKREMRDGVLYNTNTGNPVPIIRLSETGEAYNSDSWKIAPFDSGLNTDTFGPINTRIQRRSSHPVASSVPIVSTTAKIPEDGSAPSVDVSFYVNSFGIQTISYGAVIVDSGDAPQSYGSAEHLLRTGAEQLQPYLGTTTADIMSVPKAGSKDWFHDDVADTEDEGIAQLRGDGQNNYPVYDSTNASYTIPIKATPGMLAGQTVTSYVRAWADFNGNGIFDANEAAETVTVNASGTFNLQFTNPNPQYNPNTNKLGIRVRIAENEEEITLPTGFATTGEVEDFYVPVVQPPKGNLDTTTGDQGEPQTSNFNVGTFFTAVGVTANDQSVNTQILSNSVGIVNPDDPNGALLQTYTRAGEGTYTLLPGGAVKFTPEPNFVGKAVGVALRATDTNGKTTGWTSDPLAQAKAKETNPEVEVLQNTNSTGPIKQDAEAPTSIYGSGSPTMDAVYQPTVNPKPIKAENATSTDTQDVNQTRTVVFKTDAGEVITPSEQYPTTFVNSENQPISENSIPALDNEGKQIGTYTLDPNTGTVTFDPNPDFIGTPQPARVQFTNQHGMSAVGLYTPTVTPNQPTGHPITSEGWQGESQTGTPTYTDALNEPFTASESNPAKLVDPETGQATDATVLPAKDASGKQVGTYTIDPNTGVVTFQPNRDFVGTPVGVDVQVNDRWGQPATGKYTPKVKALTPTGSPAVSEGPQGEAQTGTPTFKDGKDNPLTPGPDRPAKLVDPETGTLVDTIPAKDASGKQVGTYTIDPNTGVVTFQPNRDFVGTPVPANVRIHDDNGTPATTTYTPTVTALIPTAENVVSRDIQGKAQTGKPTFKDGKQQPLTPGTDRPAKLVDPQTGALVDTIPAVDENGNQIGTYTIVPETGVVTFQPIQTFVGTAVPAQVQMSDDNGTSVRGLYTPTVDPLYPPEQPDGEGATSIDKQGKSQTGTPTYKDGDEQPIVPSADNPAKFIDPATGQPTDATELPALKEGKKVGTYTLDPTTGVVTFTPNKDFVGTPDGIIVGVKDPYGHTAKGKYTPTVTPLEPTGDNVVSQDVQGKAQTGTPTFKDGEEQPLTPSADRPAKLVDPATGAVTDEPTVPAFSEDGTQIGTYTINPTTGVVTFQPNPEFIGRARPATVALADDNGTKAFGLYTPTVTPLLPPEPQGDGTTSTGKQGKVQTGTPTFKDGNDQPLVPSADNPAKFIDPATGQPTDATELPAMKNGKQVGTYTLDPATGVVTFTPDGSFIGTPDGVTVGVRDPYGHIAKGKYTPTVIPMSPTGENAYSEGPQGEKQTGTPTFKDGDDQPLLPSPERPAKLVDPRTGELTDEPTVPALDTTGKQIGTYTINPATGVVTFTPNLDFVGTPVGAIVKVPDEFGNLAAGVYTPTVTPKPVTPVAPPKPKLELPKTGMNGFVAGVSALLLAAGVVLLTVRRKVN